MLHAPPLPHNTSKKLAKFSPQKGDMPYRKIDFLVALSGCKIKYSLNIYVPWV